jgi:4-hydroxythreonine-4-phosphate dehydrogenase
VAAYHDQILPLIKGLGGFRAVNMTAGLPYLRLSVDHGTGFDIAGKNIADCEGLLACSQLILKISHSEKSKIA